MARYGTKKKDLNFNNLVDAIGSAYPLEYLARPSVRKSAESTYGIAYPPDFEEALAEERAENPDYRKKRVTTRPKARSVPVSSGPHPKAAARKPRTRTPAASTPTRTTPAKSASKTRARRSATPRTASVSMPKPAATRKPRKPRVVSAEKRDSDQLARTDKINAYRLAEREVRALGGTGHFGKTLTALAESYKKSGARIYATYKKHL